MGAVSNATDAGTAAGSRSDGATLVAAGISRVAAAVATLALTWPLVRTAAPMTAVELHIFDVAAGTLLFVVPERRGGEDA
jgi:hypothetical protein